jgi:hypothetical protein
MKTGQMYLQTPVSISEGIGIPNNGGMRTIERIHLAGPDTLLTLLPAGVSRASRARRSRAR